MNKLTLASTLILTLFFAISCKKCDPSNSIDGIIVKDAIVRDLAGFYTGQQFINSDSQYPTKLEMSLDGGETYTSVDFNKYSVFALPTTASCSSGYNKKVEVNKSKGTVNYNIDITECETCEGTVRIHNWVLTSKVPSNYTPIFTVSKN